MASCLRYLRMTAVALAISVLWAGLALAQSAVENYDGQGEPTSVPRLELARPLESWGMIALFIVGTLAIAFKSSKRGTVD